MDGSTIPTDDDITTIQEDEISAIEAIYRDDFRRVQSKSNAWQVCIILFYFFALTY